MSLTLSTWAKEESTYTITVSFYDDNDTLATPTSATWSLSDPAGNIINSREDVVISSLDTSVDVELSGDDLALGSYGNRRVFTVKAIDVNSDPVNDEVFFRIRKLTNVS